MLWSAMPRNQSFGLERADEVPLCAEERLEKRVEKFPENDL